MFDTSHLHPMIVHFPIALLITGFLFEVAGLIINKEFFSKAGFYLLVLGSAGVLAAYFSGQNAGSGIEEAGPLKDALELHEDAALLSAILSGVALAMRVGLVFYKKYQGTLKYVSVFLFLAAVLLSGELAIMAATWFTNTLPAFSSILALAPGTLTGPLSPIMIKFESG